MPDIAFINDHKVPLMPRLASFFWRKVWRQKADPLYTCNYLPIFGKTRLQLPAFSCVQSCGYIKKYKTYCGWKAQEVSRITRKFLDKDIIRGG